MPNPCKIWISAPGQKHVTLESNLPFIYSYCLKVYLPSYQNCRFQICSIVVVKATQVMAEYPLLCVNSIYCKSMIKLECHSAGNYTLQAKAELFDVQLFSANVLSAQRIALYTIMVISF